MQRLGLPGHYHEDICTRVTLGQVHRCSVSNTSKLALFAQHEIMSDIKRKMKNTVREETGNANFSENIITPKMHAFLTANDANKVIKSCVAVNAHELCSNNEIFQMRSFNNSKLFRETQLRSLENHSGTSRQLSRKNFSLNSVLVKCIIFLMT